MCSNFFLAKAERYCIIQKIFRSEREHFGSIMNFVSRTNIFDFLGGRLWENESKRSLKNVGLTLLKVREWDGLGQVGEEVGVGEK